MRSQLLSGWGRRASVRGRLVATRGCKLRARDKVGLMSLSVLIVGVDHRIVASSVIARCVLHWLGLMLDGRFSFLRD